MESKLVLILGPMFSSKTQALIQYVKRFSVIDKKILSINFENDTRYGSSRKITTHDGNNIDCFSLCRLTNYNEHKDILEAYKTADIICVNEGQFFDDLDEFCSIALKDGKYVVVCGLSGDYKQQPFPNITNVLGMADDIIHTKALCVECKDGTKAPFTKRIVEDERLYVIGGSESYKPVCRKHL